MPACPEERIVAVEIKLMHQERLLETLNQVIIELRAELDGLRTELERMAVERRGAGAGEDEAPANDPPPHY